MAPPSGRSRKATNKGASSKQAAQLLPEHLAAGKFTSLADITGIVLGERSWQTERTPQEAPLTTETPVADLQCWDETSALIAQRLLKRDESTKVRALQDLSAQFDNLERSTSVRITDQAAYAAQYGAFLGNFSMAFMKLAHDPSPRVRMDSVTLVGQLVRLFGKRTIALLPTLLPAWLGLFGDPFKEVAERAAMTFQEAFPTASKRQRALLLAPHAVVRQATEQMRSCIRERTRASTASGNEGEEMSTLQALASVHLTIEALVDALVSTRTFSNAELQALVELVPYWLENWIFPGGIDSLSVPLFRRYRRSIRIHEAFWRLTVRSFDLLTSLMREDDSRAVITESLARSNPRWRVTAVDGLCRIVSRLVWDELHASCQNHVWAFIIRFVKCDLVPSSALEASISATSLRCWLLGESVVDGRQASLAERLESARSFGSLLPFLQALRARCNVKECETFGSVEKESVRNWVENLENELMEQLETTLLWRAPKTRFPPALVGASYVDWWQAALVSWMEGVLWIHRPRPWSYSIPDESRCSTSSVWVQLERFLLNPAAIGEDVDSERSVVRFNEHQLESRALSRLFLDVLVHVACDACQTTAGVQPTNWNAAGEYLATALIQGASASYTAAVCAALERALAGSSFSSLSPDRQPRWSLLEKDMSGIPAICADMLGGALHRALEPVGRRDSTRCCQTSSGYPVEAVAVRLTILEWCHCAPVSLVRRYVQCDRLLEFLGDTWALLDAPLDSSVQNDEIKKRYIRLLGTLAALCMGSTKLGPFIAALNQYIGRCSNLGLYLEVLARSARVRAQQSDTRQVGETLWTDTQWFTRLESELESLQKLCSSLEPSRCSLLSRHSWTASSRTGLIFEFAAWPDVWMFPSPASFSEIAEKMNETVGRALQLGLWDVSELEYFRLGAASRNAPWTNNTLAWLYVRLLFGRLLVENDAEATCNGGPVQILPVRLGGDALAQVAIPSLCMFLEDLEGSIPADDQQKETVAPDKILRVFQTALRRLAAAMDTPWQRLLYQVLIESWPTSEAGAELMPQESSPSQLALRRALLNAFVPALDDDTSPMDVSLWCAYLRWPWTRSWAISTLVAWLHRASWAADSLATSTAAGVLVHLLQSGDEYVACRDQLVTTLAQTPAISSVEPEDEKPQLHNEKRTKGPHSLLTGILVLSPIVRARLRERLGEDLAGFGSSLTASWMVRSSLAALELSTYPASKSVEAMHEFALELLRSAAGSLAESLPQWTNAIIVTATRTRDRGLGDVEKEASSLQQLTSTARSLYVAMEILGFAVETPVAYVRRADLLTYLRSAFELLTEIEIRNVIEGLSALQLSPLQSTFASPPPPSLSSSAITAMERKAIRVRDSLDEDFVQVSTREATVSSSHRALDSQQVGATVSIDSAGGEHELRVLNEGWPSRVLAAMLERILLPSIEAFAFNLSEEQWEWIAETANDALDSDLGWTVYAAALRCLRVWYVHALAADCLPRLWKRMAADLAAALWLTCYRLADACRLALEQAPTTRMEAPLALDAQDALGYLLNAACSDMEQALSTTNALSRSTLVRSWPRLSRNLWADSSTTTLNASMPEAVAPFWCLRWLPFLLAVGSDNLRSAVMQLLAARWDALEAWIAETALFSSQRMHEQELVPRQATCDDHHLDPSLGIVGMPLEAQASGSTTSISARPDSGPQRICKESIAEPDSISEFEAFANLQPSSGGFVPAAASNDENGDGCSTKDEPEDFNETVEDLSKDQLSSLIAVACQHDELIRQCCETLLALTASFPSNFPAKKESLQPTMVYFGSWLILMRLHVSGRHLKPFLTPLATRLPTKLLEEALQKLLDGLATRWIRYVPIQPTLSPERIPVDAAESAGFREQLETLLAGLSERLVTSGAEPEWLDSALFWEPTDWRPAALGARLLLLVLLIQPLQAQRWFSDHVADRSITQPVETLTRNLVTPYLIARELEAIRRYAAKQNSLAAGQEAESTRGLLSVQGSVAAREILALYHFEDVQLPVCLRLADAYPWRPTELTTADERLGIKATTADRDSRNLPSFQARYRRLFIHMTRILQQGIDEHGLDTDTPPEAPPLGPNCYFGRSALVACIMYWHRRLVALLSEAPECPICYHVLHMRTGQVSRVRCPTCRHRFHAACLYRWFSSATHGATCPMCRSPF